MSTVEDQIKTVVEGVASNWDVWNWNEAKKLFADVSRDWLYIPGCTSSNSWPNWSVGPELADGVADVWSHQTLLRHLLNQNGVSKGSTK